jgi:NAD+ diphosphatase
MLNLIFVGNDLIIEQDDQQNINFPSLNYIHSLNLPLEIVQDDAEGFIAYISKTEFNNFENKIQTINIRQALCYFSEDECQKIIYYLQLTHYYSGHKFCGICGHALIKNVPSKFMICLQCHHEAYPKLAPCIIVRITHGDKILLARGAQFPAGMWALIAGFVELGESLEEALHREVMEEVGIKVENIRYWGSQSWPIPTSSLMIGFTAEYKSGDLKIDNNEIVEAGFFTKETIPGIPPTQFSIAGRMIEEFINNDI